MKAYNSKCNLRLLCLALLVPSLAFAQVPRETNPAQQKPVASLPPQPQQTPAQLSKQDIEAFLDGVVPLQLQRDDIAGAVVVVVKDGQVLFAKGYGFADVKARKPVTVDGTLFRPGSISKTFTWTAVMQQVEQGKIDLDHDINEYLDFKIPATFSKPITMRNLMTHTPGSEETLKELFVGSATDLRPLNEYLPSHLPKQIFPPGTTPAYSNFGATLAGYIVQRVSGTPFNEYVEQNILQPLGMVHSTFRQPLPENLKPLMSEGYKKASQPPRSFEFVEAYPAGSMSVSGEDMAHYMIAHLQNGQYNGGRILNPETAQRMHSRVFGLMPEMNGSAYGFYEETRNGHRIIGHGGDTQWFHSDMHLMFDQGLGFFVSYNSAGKGDISERTMLWQNFLNRYFPYTPPPPENVASAAGDAKAVAGTYWSSRRSETNLLAVGSAVDQAKVRANQDGTISLDQAKDFSGNPKHFREIAPMLFREEHGQSRLAFTKDYAGRQIIVTDVPIHVYQPVPPLKNGRVNLAIMVFAIVLFALTLLFWPINALLRRHYGRPANVTPEYTRLRAVVRLMCVLDLVFVIGVAVWGSSIDDNIAILSSHYDLTLHILQALGMFGAIAGAACVYFCVRSWRDRDLWLGAKVWNTLLLVAAAGYVWFALNWHLLNFNLRY